MNSKSFLFLSFLFLFSFKTGDSNDQMILQNYEEQFSNLGKYYKVLLFPEKSYSLSEKNQKIISDLIKKSDDESEPVTLIKILSWSDQEYPDEEDEKLSPDDEYLALERGEAIKAFIEGDLGRHETIKIFNMAKRPNFFSEVAKNDEYQTKEAFEESGPTSSILPDGEISFTKASKALVIIDFKSKSN